MSNTNKGKPASTGSTSNTASGNKEKAKSSAYTVQDKKRAYTEVANSSAEEIQLIHHQLETLSDDMRKQGEHIKNLMTKNDIHDMIKSTTENVMKEMKEQIGLLVDQKVNERCQELTDRIDSLEFEKGELKERLDEAMNKIEEIQTEALDNDKIAKEAMKLANANEQYSRKNNVKIMELPEGEEETEISLTRLVCDLLLDKANITLDPHNIDAIHRIPGKPNKPKPLLVRFRNNNVKTTVMKARKVMKESGHRLVDDVTKMNTGLMNRLNLHEKIDSAWFFNGSVFGKTVEGKRLKFNLYDSIDSIIKPPKEKK